MSNDQKNEEKLEGSEAVFRSIIEQSPFSTLLFRPDGTVIFANEASARVWGADPGAVDFILKHYNILQDEQLKAKGVMSYIVRGFTEGPTEIPEVHYEHKDTPSVSEIKERVHPTWVVGHIWPIRDENNKIVQVLLMHEDTTKRKEAELKLMEEKNSLEKLNKLMVGREVKMVELKKELKVLRERVSKPNE
ncbi:MAG: hypothetical protein HY226_03275 [Candidatus Vogelbacteria bacterium]|nr:hypothetical protein [Candidatus Vogelbacteria bacterium]